MRIYCVRNLPDLLVLDGSAIQDQLSAHLEQEVARGAALGFSHFLLTAAALAYVHSIDETTPETRPDSIYALLSRHCHSHGLGLLLEMRWPLSNQADQRTPADVYAALVAAGVQGFLCSTPLSRPAEAWRELISGLRLRSTHGLQFLAWTPGLSPAQLEALVCCGFDAVVSSLPWWDFKHPWLAEEQQRLRSFSALLLNPLADLVGSGPPQTLSALAARRLLQCAAACGDGVLMPADFADVAEDLPAAVSEVNRRLRQRSAVGQALTPAVRMLSSRYAPLTLLAHSEQLAPDQPEIPLILAINPSLTAAASYPIERILAAWPGREGAAGLRPDGAAAAVASGSSASAQDERPTVPGTELRLQAGEVCCYQVLSALPTAPAARAGRSKPATPTGKRSLALLDAALRAPRIALENVQPICDAGRFAVKRVVGERVMVEADVWMDGHDTLAVALAWRGPGAKHWQEAPMQALGNDRWRGGFALEQLGRYEFTVRAWHDPYESWLHEVEKKHAAGQDLTLEIETGRLLALHIATAASSAGEVAPPQQLSLARLSASLGKTPASTAAQRAALWALLSASATRALLAACGYRPFQVMQEPAYTVQAERLAARFGSWYELFPRAQTDDAARHGNFDDVIARLPAISAMGFDVLYFPPLHPIGQTHRKGRNNSLSAQPDDPGSPYAIGATDGGHEALHPQLGSFDDFQRLLVAAKAHGMELALDFAIQCSPDHPWLRDHPQWFSYRSDGTVRYAENPPKKYQDIVNVDFYNDDDAAGLWHALRDIVLFWAARGIRIFRVDNPHTKPLPFWEWLIAEVRSLHPDIIFLAEAFTRPKPMARLAKIGFSQSYTYFTWRNDKPELTAYLEELTTTPLREYFRPHFFVNTPDINPYFLQNSGRPGFLIRAALASLLSGLWGMLSGYELCEARPLVVDGEVKEEYADSDKFEIRPRDWQQSGHIVNEISRLNSLRRNYPALQNHLGLRFYAASNDQVLYFARYTEPLEAQPHGPFGDCVLLIAINLDPFNSQQAEIELPLWEWGLPDHAALQAEDLLHGERFVWRGKRQQIALHPGSLPFAIWQVQPMADVGTET